MVTATGLTAACPADAAGRGDASGTAPACAVHTEAPAASNVTPSAAPATLPYQPRLLPCRAMSAPLSRSSSVAVRPPGRTSGEGRRMRLLRITDNSGREWGHNRVSWPCLRVNVSVPGET